MSAHATVVDDIVDLIVPLVEPDKIILFGSYARGDQTEKSDVDLLVLKKGLDDERGTVDKIYYSFIGKKIEVDVDVIAMDYERYMSLINVTGYIYKSINKDGKVVYESL